MTLSQASCALPNAAGRAVAQTVENPVLSNSDLVEVDACYLFQLFTPSSDGGPPSLTSDAPLRWAAAAMLATEHINARDCSIIGRGCEALISPLGKKLRISPLIFDMEDFSSKLAAISAVQCQQAGVSYMVGTTTSAQSNIVSQLAAVSDQFLVSSAATSPALSDKDTYPSFARSAYSDGDLAETIVLLCKEFGWQQVALLHNRDLFGTGYADAFTKAMRNSELSYQTMSLGMVVTETTVAEAVEALKQSGMKIVVTITFSQYVPMILRAANTIFGEDMKKLVWFSGGVPVADVLDSNQDLFEEDPELLRLVEGMIGISASPAATQVASRLKGKMVNFQDSFEDALRMGLARGVQMSGAGGAQQCNCEAPGNETVMADPRSPDQQMLDSTELAENTADVLKYYESNDLSDSYTMHAYDAVWLLATAVSSAIGASGEGKVPTGSDVISVLRNGIVPGLQAVYGYLEWDSSGDLKSTGLNVRFDTYSKRPVAETATNDVVITWNQEGGFKFNDSLPIIWADGTVYPQIPADGTVKDMLAVYMGSGLGALCVIAAASFFIYRREQAKKTNPLIGVNVKKIISEVHSNVHDMQGGKVADYIPALASGNPNHFAIAICTVKGKVYSVGDDSQKFTIQSAAKPFMYAQMIELQDIEYTNTKINVEPSGQAFNSHELLNGRPYNPLVNQGAIASCCLAFPQLAREDRYQQMNDFMSSCATKELQLDKRCYEGESQTGDQNRRIAGELLKYGCVETETDSTEGLEAYFMGCSTLVDVKELAVMGATVANKGKNPKTKKAVIDPDTAEAVSSVMMTCGMYNGAGNWMRDVGLPAKSGVSGCLLAVVPGVCGIAVFSPPLDENGNSFRGTEVCKMLSEDLGLHVLKNKKNKAGGFRSSIAGGSKSVMGGAKSSASASRMGGNAGAKPMPAIKTTKVVPLPPGSKQPYETTPVEDLESPGISTARAVSYEDV